MLGLVHHNIAVLSVIIDRKLFWTHTIVKSDPDWTQHLESFLLKKDPNKRVRVVMFDDIYFSNRLRIEIDSIAGANGDSILEEEQKSLFLLFDTPDNVNTINGIEILDATKEGDVWKFHKILPPDLNSKLQGAQRGLLLPPKKIVKDEEVKQRATFDIFDPATTLFFQKIEDLLAVITDPSQQQTLRCMIATGYSSGVEDPDGKVHKKLMKLGVDLEAYANWVGQAKKLKYLDNLKLSLDKIIANPEIIPKDVAQEYNVRSGDVKWLKNNLSDDKCKK